jgi:23S rRNA (pseudouridine1915-N3)-methyltransferase
MKMRIVAIGRPRSRDVRALVDLYFGRIEHYCRIEITFAKDEKDAMVKIGGRSYLIILDEKGAQMSSLEFSKLVEGHLLKGTKDVTFLVGGQNGHGEPARKRANKVISMSRMTLPHELALVFLLEQIYRGFSIMRGEPYHRE